VSQSAQPDYEAGLKGFLDEARRLAGLDHPNIVKVHDYCEAFGTGYLVMSYYEGRDLRQHTEAAGGRLDWQEATNLVLPMLDGLAEVHRLGLIHRDIKPANTYLARRADGKTVPILIDFGAARWTTSTKELTAILTEGFAPLEQYPGCGPQGPFTDVYATAATLYAVISGSSPASAPSRLASSYVSHLTDQVPGVPRRLGDAVEQAMSIQSEDRPQSAAEFARLLRAALPQVGSRPAPQTGQAPAVKGDEDRTVVAPRVELQGARTAPIGDGVPTTRPTPEPKKPFPKAIVGIAAVVLIAAAVVVPKLMSRPENTVPPPGPVKPDPSSAVTAQLESEAMRHFQDAQAALAAGEYASAMKAAGAMHTLAVRADWTEQARGIWGPRADSLASVVVSGCPADPARKRETNPPPCPARTW
jgi:serine/threonine protein kinase